ncbi:MAG TPA: hypothetical protein VFU32_15265 [Ktedonobacterales bacterium]|nr:hypothetical protein [Ktedonobacterales bacterium]
MCLDPDFPAADLLYGAAENTSLEQPQSRPGWRWRWLALAAALAFLTLAACYHYLIYLPQPDRPHRLTALDDLFALGVAALVALTGLVLGQWLLRPFRLAGFSSLERGALAIGVGWGLLSLGVLALGLTHLLYLWALLAMIGVIVLAGWRDVGHVLATLSKREWYRSLDQIKPKGFWEHALALLALVELVFVGLQALTLPYVPLGYDLYQYHWAVPELFLLHHQVYAFPGWAHADFPIQNDLLSLLALAVQEPVAALLIQMTFGLLCLVLLAGALYRCAGRSGAWLGIALYLGSPLLTSVLGNGYAESALAYYAVASLVVALAGLRQRSSTEGAASWRLLFLGGIFAGIGLATKYTQLQVIVGMGALIPGAGVLMLVRARREQQPLKPIGREMALGAAAYASGVMLPLVPWLMKDWALLGNPIYPFVWGGPGWNAARAQMGVVTFDHFGPPGPLWLRLLSAFFSLFFDGSHMGEPHLLPPNYTLLTVALVPIFWLFTWRHQKSQTAGKPQRPSGHAAPWLLVGGCGYVLWVLSQALVGRYAIAWVALLIVPATAALLHVHQLLRRWPLVRGALQSVVLFLLLLQGPISTSQYLNGNNPLALLTGAQSLRQWEAQHLMEPDYWSMVDYVNAQLPRDAKVLLVGQAAGYFLQGRDYIADSGDDWIPYLETEGRTHAGMLKVLQQNGFRYLIYGEKTLQYIVDTYGNAYLGSFLPAFRQFLTDSLTEVWSYQDFHIYKIPL